MRRTLTAVGCAVGLGLVAPAAAAADGGPVLPVQGGAGVSAPGGEVHYVAVRVRGGTLIERRRAGTAERRRLLRGSFGVPGVAFDGSTTGLSADGRRLVVAAIPRRQPPRVTRLVVLDARRLHVRRRIALPGLVTVDAVSPTGRWLYLVRYASARDTLRYEVRAYDLRASRLLPRPVVDPREPDEAMRGTPVTRATSADGRWAYTLYLRPDGAPFVHALDTERRTAACVDLPEFEITDPTAVRLALTHAGAALQVRDASGPRALVDTRTFAVSAPAPPSPAPPDRPPAARGSGDGAPPWVPVTLAAGLLVAFAALVRAVRRRPTRRSPPRTGCPGAR